MTKAEQTRVYILEKAFELIYQNGYQATSIDKIIETTHVSKGAFYYHFKNKEEMGLAMIKEVVAPRLSRLLILPLKNGADATKLIHTTIETNLLDNNDFDIRYGCPINNLVQEMSPINNSFKKALRNVLNSWKKALVNLLEKGKKAGEIRTDIDSASVAEFIIVSYEGLRGTGKVYQNKRIYKSYAKQLKNYLDSLA